MVIAVRIYKNKFEVSDRDIIGEKLFELALLGASDWIVNNAHKEFFLADKNRNALNRELIHVVRLTYSELVDMAERGGPGYDIPKEAAAEMLTNGGRVAAEHLHKKLTSKSVMSRIFGG